MKSIAKSLARAGALQPSVSAYPRWIGAVRGNVWFFSFLPHVVKPSGEMVGQLEEE